MSVSSQIWKIDQIIFDQRLCIAAWPGNCKLIVSTRNYESTPSVQELLNLVAQIRATGADIVRIATTAADIVDTSRMFRVLAHCQVSFAVLKFLSTLVLLRDMYSTTLFYCLYKSIWC